MTVRLHLDLLPPRTTKGTVVRLLIQVGGLEKRLIGAVQVFGRHATAEVPQRNADRLIAALDGSKLGHGKIRAWCELPDGGGDADGGGPPQESHFLRLRSLLQLEAEAEDRRLLEGLRKLPPKAAELTGRSMYDMRIVDEQAGLGGRAIVRLQKSGDAKRPPPLPWTRLGVGSPVMLSADDDETTVRGVVCVRTEFALDVALEQPPDVSGEARLRVDHSSDQVAQQRQRQALDRARSAVDGPLAQFRKVLTGRRTPQFGPPEPLDELVGELNTVQQEAVQFALTAEDYAIIHGPPGTGKTTTLAELISQAVRREQRVLACAPSNLAVDNMLERLLQRGVAAVRLGHPARVSPQLREKTLDLMVSTHPDMKLANGLLRQSRQLRRRASRWTRAPQTAADRRELRNEAKLLVEDARRIESQVIESILESAPVLCATTTSLNSELLGQMQFDWAVIDEACQSTEPGCWIPLLRCRRLVMAGDHCQLPPTVISTDAQRQGFGVSLMERMIALHGTAVSRRLEVQYRMHQAIQDFSSAEFYESTLQPDPAVAGRDLRELLAPDDPLASEVVSFWDTAGAGFDEEKEQDGDSLRNPQEAELVVQLVAECLSAGLAAGHISVITPYAAQVRLLRERLKQLARSQGGEAAASLVVEADTVDGFQGRETDVVIMSLVRSNPGGEIGFLRDFRRMNVALTRARRRLVVVGDSATIGAQPFYQRLLQYFESLGAYHSVWERSTMQ